MRCGCVWTTSAICRLGGVRQVPPRVFSALHITDTYLVPSFRRAHYQHSEVCLRFCCVVRSSAGLAESDLEDAVDLSESHGCHSRWLDGKVSPIVHSSTIPYPGTRQPELRAADLAPTHRSEIALGADEELHLWSSLWIISTSGL